MADLTKTISIIFGAKSEVAQVTKAIEKDIDNLSKPLAAAASTVAKLDAALAALAVGGLVYAFKKSVDFENSVVSLRKVVGDAPADMKAAQDAALKLSGVYGESATKILESTANFVQAGFNVQESIMLTKNAMDLKIAGDVSAAESSQYLVSILKGFKAPAEDAARVVDILNEVSNKYATDVQQLAIGMADLSPIARIMGFSFEETAGLLTPVIEVFGSGSESARALRTGLLKLIDDTKPVGEALDSLGVKQKSANGELRSGKDILLDVSKAFKGLSEPQKLFITQQLTGIDQSAKMVEVFNGLNKSVEVTQVAMKSAGSAQQEVNARLASSEVTINRLGVGFENLARTIGDKFKLSVTGAIAGGVDLEEALRNITNSGAFDDLLAQLNKFANSIGLSLKNVAKNLPAAFAMVDWSSLLHSIGEVGKELGALFDIDTKDPEALADTIQTVADSISSLIDVSRGMGAVFVPIIKTAGGVVEGFNSLDESTKTLVGNLLGAAAAYKIFGPVVGTIMFLLGQDSETMAKTVNTSFASVENGINAIKVGVLSLAVVFAHASEGMAKLLDLVAITDKRKADSAEDLQRTGDRVKLLDDMLLKANSDLVISSDKVAAAFSGTTEKVKTAESATDKYAKALGNIPTSLETEFNIDDLDNAEISVARMATLLAALSGKQEVVIEVLADGTSIETADGIITKKFPDGRVLVTNLAVEMSDLEFDTVVKKIDKAVPGKKEIELQAKLDVDKLKAEADTIQKAVEWKAKLDIANVEASTKILEATFKSIDNTITSTGNTITAMMGNYAAVLSGGQGGRTFIEQQITEENRRRNEALEMQKGLVAAEIDNLKARTEALKGGQAMIQIDGKGLQPQLEAFMFEILKQIQVRANAEGAKFLTGL